MTMELPPGSRGYGTSEIVTHPDSESRHQEVTQLITDNKGLNRHELQNILMPYDLPKKYRNRNQRIGIKDA